MASTTRTEAPGSRRRADLAGVNCTSSSSYGLPVRLRLLPTPPHGDAVAFGYKGRDLLWAGLPPTRQSNITDAPALDPVPWAHGHDCGGVSTMVATRFARSDGGEVMGPRPEAWDGGGAGRRPGPCAQGP